MEFVVKIVKGLTIVFIIYLLIFTLNIIYSGYKRNYFNEFTKAELNLYTSKFSRDANEKYAGNDSYKIESLQFNDAMFYKNIEVIPNTAYKVSCKVKTKDILPKNTPSESGAQISIADTMEKSISVQGTQDWQEIVMYFDSKNRNNVNIAFRLGGFEDDCIGTAWFSDFKVERGALSNDSTWNVACFIFKNLDTNVEINGKMQNVKVNMSSEEIYHIKNAMQRFKNTCQEFSNHNMKVNYDIMEINEPITSVANDEQNGYYISGKNVANQIDSYLAKKEYDHIFVVVKLGDLAKEIEIPVRNWLGLGSMVYRGIGFSNIRIPSDKNNKLYVYDSQYNVLPEEVFLHEFLHDLERISKENGYEVPVLHDYENYGYKNENVQGLKEWYKAYMSKTILDKEKNRYVGLDAKVYTKKPVKASGFHYTLEVEFIKEPSNFIEEVVKMFQNTFRIVTVRLQENRV